MSDDPAPLSPKERSVASTAKLPALSTYQRALAEADQRLARGETLKSLSAKQECFAQAYAEGVSASEAYRYAYQVSDVPWQVAARARELVGMPHVAARVRDIKAISDAKLLRDKEKTQRYVIDNLQKIIELPGSHHSARVHALTLLGKVSGLFDGSNNGANASADKRTARELERELKAKLDAMLGKDASNIKGLDVLEHEPGASVAQVIANNPDDENGVGSVSDPVGEPG